MNVETLPPSQALAIALCARSQQHTAGSGRHDAVRYDACALHRQMADETFPLAPTGLRLRVEWAVRLDGRIWMQAGERGIREFVEIEPDAQPVTRVVLTSPDGLYLDSPWENVK